MQHSIHQAFPRPTLSIWNPDDDDDLEQERSSESSQPPPQLVADGPSLTEAFRRHRLPEMGPRAPDTIKEYDTHLRRWEQFWRAFEGGWRPINIDLTNRINNPVPPSVRGVNRTDLLGFREWLAQHPEELSNRTINKHLGSLQAIGESCVTAGLLGAFPKIKPLEATKAARKLNLSYEEADTLKRACEVADWPNGLLHPAPAYWEAAVVGWCVYGFRTQEQIRVERRMRTLEWTDIRSAIETPHPDGKAKNPHGWLVYTPQKQERRKPEPLVLPVVEAYRRHLEAIRPPNPKGPVFPFPLNGETFYDTWDKILAAAGIQPKPGLDNSQPEYQIKHLRKTATRWINDHGATIGMPGIGDQVTGHAADRAPDREVQSAVTREHYDFAEDRVLRALTTLPLPPSFAEPITLRQRRQRRLF